MAPFNCPVSNYPAACSAATRDFITFGTRVHKQLLLLQRMFVQLDCIDDAVISVSKQMQGITKIAEPVLTMDYILVYSIRIW